MVWYSTRSPKCIRHQNILCAPLESRLRQDDLRCVWGLSDAEPRGKLTKAQFFKSCKLVALRQNGNTLNPKQLGKSNHSHNVNYSAPIFKTPNILI